jgi:nicotinate phosphoribosyltransferase
MLTDHLRPLNPTPYKVSVTETVYRDFHQLWERSAPIKDISNLNVEVDD